MKTCSVTMLLAAYSLGIDTACAFQSPLPTSASWSRATKRKSTNDLYTAGFATPPQELNSILPPTTNTQKRPISNDPIIVQGDSLRTWSYKSPFVEQLQVTLSSEGRPFDADIELWNGPNNTPAKMRVYAENGKLRPLDVIVETPRAPNTIAIRNIGQLEFPFAANVRADNVANPSFDASSSCETIQGGALRTYHFDAVIDAIQVLLKTDGRPLNARIELLQGPNNNKQVIELYAEDGLNRPFFCIIKTPGSGNVVRVLNTGPVEFPMVAGVVAHTINKNFSSDAVVGGDNAF